MNFTQISCLKILSRHHSLWVSFTSFEAKVKWFELINEQYERLLEQDLDRRRRTSSHPNKKRKSASSQKDKVKEIYLPLPAMVPDDYSDNCMSCKSTFTMLNRRHHCYYCGLLLCDTCTSKRVLDQWKHFFDGVEVIVRVCDSCFEDREQYLKAKENEYLYYLKEKEFEEQQQQNANNAKGKQRKQRKSAKSDASWKLKPLSGIDMETVMEEDALSSAITPPQASLISPSTIDITKTFISSGTSSRLNKRRANMSRIHSKSKES